jgi:hypothetical protein
MQGSSRSPYGNNQNDDWGNENSYLQNQRQNEVVLGRKTQLKRASRHEEPTVKSPAYNSGNHAQEFE